MSVGILVCRKCCSKNQLNSKMHWKTCFQGRTASYIWHENAFFLLIILLYPFPIGGPPPPHLIGWGTQGFRDPMVVLCFSTHPPSLVLQQQLRRRARHSWEKSGELCLIPATDPIGAVVRALELSGLYMSSSLAAASFTAAEVRRRSPLKKRSKRKRKSAAPEKNAIWCPPDGPVPLTRVQMSKKRYYRWHILWQIFIDYWDEVMSMTFNAYITGSS